MTRARSFLLIGSALAGFAAPAVLFVGAAAAQEVVQPLPHPAQADLSDALRRLSRNPENIRALVDAGNASLALGDYGAALGFFNRAQRVDPEYGPMLAGLAQVAVRRGEGVIAVQLFDNAAAAGEPMGPLSAVRGLAYDLVGNNTRAQRLYRVALSGGESDEVIRRLALSYAISGDGSASEATLLPLLQRQDRAAYRTRAFALAILGRDEEAIAIAEAMLPPRLSSRLQPYLRYMPQLTPAQQAAAANLGRFPSLAEIGRDSPQIAALEDEEDVAPVAPPANADRLTPAGEPLGQAAPPAALDENGELPALAAAEPPATLPAPAQPPEAEPEFVPEPEPEPAPVPAPTPEPGAELPAVVDEPPVSAPPPSDEPSAVVVATLEEDSEPADPAPAEEARPSFSISDLEPDPAPPPAVDPEVEEVIAETEARTEEQLGLEEAFADFVLPGSDLPVAPSDGAVDITTIEPAREEPEEDEPAAPPPPAHPSRIWVQVATGQDTSAFRFDWRRLVRSADGLLDGRDAYTAPWNSTNRLLTGPFDSVREASQFVTQLGEAGVDAFRFTSAEGQEITPLD